MSEHSSIQWTDATLNVVTGCTRVSEGCDRCYIERTPPFRMAGRKFDKPGVGGTTGVQLHPERLTLPLKWRKPQRIFVNSLSDLFHDDVPDQFLDEVFGMMAVAHQVRGHVFQVLTKRPARMRSYLAQTVRSLPGGYIGSTRQAIAYAAHRWAIDRTNAGALSDEIEHGSSGWPVAGVWLGVSVENQKWADIRIPILLDTPAAVRWLSCEPLLGPVDLAGFGTRQTYWLTGQLGWGPAYPDPTSPAGILVRDFMVGPRISWVVTGGESGPHYRLADPAWFRTIRDQCAAADVAYLHKQNGGGTSKSGGRELDGRLHDEYPQAVA